MHIEKKTPVDKKSLPISYMLTLYIQRTEKDYHRKKIDIYEISKNDPLLDAS